MKNTRFTINEIMQQLMKNAGSRKERFNLIFRLNNALVLESELQKVTNDKSYKLNGDIFIDIIEFVNDQNQTIRLDECGSICRLQSSVVPEGLECFENLAIQRLLKTYEMMNVLGPNNTNKQCKNNCKAN